MRIALLGDIALIGRYDRIISSNIESRVDAVKKIVRNCDYVIANLESPLTSIKNTCMCKGVYLKSDPLNIETLRYMGVTHVTLANNHIFDYGKRGATDTIRTLNSCGIRYVGLNNPPELLSKDNSSVILDGFCCLSTNGLNYGHKKGQVKLLTDTSLEQFLVLAERMGCVPIASVHFGIEGLHYPSREHQEMFRKASERHSFVLHGNHPHAIQGIERFNDSLLVYAQGNLCFDVTPVTSFHECPEENIEERKHYIVIIEVTNNLLTSFQVIGTTDIENGVIHEDSKVIDELNKYSTALRLPFEEIDHLRNEEKINLRSSRQIRNLRFYLDRMNYKYIGAYINGKIHMKQYLEIMAKYMDK